MLSKKQKERRAQKLRALPIFTNIVRSQRPSIKNLEKLIRINERSNPPILNSYETDALQLKRQALSKAPNAIEKTMTVEQLFETGCPLWTKPYTADKIFYVIAAQKNLTKKGFTNFNKALFEILKKTEHVFYRESLEELTIKLLNERS